MKFETSLKLRKRERFYKFGIYKVIPAKKVFRQSNNLFWLILIFSIVLCFYIYKTNNSDEAYKPAMGIVVYSIFVFGYCVKFTFSLFFPELVLNEKGVKLVGRKIVSWDEIRNVKINYNENSKINFRVIKINSKSINENLNLSNLDELKIFTRSFIKKYRLRKV